ncbi:MAG TPA: kelch repeat-containing protein, partial [Candidatus Limnocylindrales bacterium]
PAKARGKLARLVPGDAKVRFERVKHSQKDLETVQQRINADLGAGRLEGRGILSTAIDTRANAVVVGASRVDDELRDALVRAYGDSVVVTLEGPSQGGDAGCVSRTDCGPAKGGIRIVRTAGGYCTSGPMVRVLGSNALRILTAGHCLALTGGTGTSKTWTHSGSGLGWSEFHTWGNGADADVGLVNPSSYPVGGPRNLLYRSSHTDVVAITSWKPTAEQIQGSLVCRSGAVSGYVCGEITLTNKTKSVDGGSIDHQWVVDFDACPGDSGAPYLVGDVAWGIHSDSTSGCNPDTNEAWYSPMGWVFDTLAQAGHPVELCTNSSCSSGANSWTAQNSLDEAAWNPGLVTLANGRVLRVGGDDGDLVPGATTASPVPSTEIFDPASRTWSDTATPPWLPNHCAGQFAARMADGTVLVGGGTSIEDVEDDPCAAMAYRFDPSTGAGGSWTDVEPMPASIISAGAVLLKDGRVLVTGGTGSDGATSLALAYSPSNDEWTTLTPAPTGAFAPLVLRLLDGRVLVSGGYTLTEIDGTEHDDSAATYLYNPANDTWASTTSVGGHGMAGVVLSDGRVAVAGGDRNASNGSHHALSTTVRLLDPTTGTWTTPAALRTARASFTLVQLPNGQLLAAGGKTPNGTSSTVDVYDWLTNAWYSAANLQGGRAMHGSAVLNDGGVLVAGGATASAEVYRLGDITPPVTATPVARLRTATTLSYPSVPARITWSAQDAGGAGVGTYDVARSTDGGAYSTVGSTW